MQAVSHRQVAFSLLGLSAVALAACSSPSPPPSPAPTVVATAAPGDLQTVKQQVESGQAVLIDVREPSEWDAGHVASAVAVPNRALTKAHQANDESGLAALLSALPKDKPIYCHCAKGVRAQSAAKILMERGYQAVPLEPGYDDLAAAGFATETAEKPAAVTP